MARLPAAPKSWSQDAKSLWRTVQDEYDLEQHHVVLLKQACELITRADDARKCIAQQGVSVEDRYGTPRPNQMIDVERGSINTARLVLRELGLDADVAHTAPEEGVRLHRSKGYA